MLRRLRAAQRESGMVSAELAAAVPAVVFLLVVAVNALIIGIDQVRCAEAARVAARAAARGDSPDAVRSAGQRNAPQRATVTTHGDAMIQVTVTSPAPGPMAWLGGGRQLTATAWAQRESTAGDGAP